MADAAELKSHVEQTDMQGFDQIVAMTEDSINASFEFRYNASAVDGPFKRWFVEIKDEGSMDVAMDAPTIHFIHEPNFQAPGDPPNIYFHLHLRSGKLTYWTGRAASSVLHTVTVEGWKLSFAVHLDAERLSKIPEAIKAKVENLGVYSVSQLLYNFTSPTISDFDPKFSVTPGFDMTSGADNGDAHGGAERLGYSVVVNTPKVNPVATFSPTSVKFQTMCHHVAGGPTAEASSGKNLFLFLQMLKSGDMDENRAMLTKALTFSGNLVAGQSAGTMAISKEFMWDKYLFPKLASVNIQAMLTLNKIVHWSKSGLDKADVTKDNYEWQLAKVQPTDGKWTTYLTDGADFAWEGFRVMDDGDTLRSNINTSVRWTAGSNVITLTGISKVKEEHDRGGNQVDIRRPELQWGVNIFLNSVKDGELEVVVQDQKDRPMCTCDAAGHYGLFSMLFGESKRADLSEKLKTVIQQAIAKENLAGNIAALVNGQNNFVFPGAGTLFLHNPVFNKKGDLLVGLNIKQ